MTGNNVFFIVTKFFLSFIFLFLISFKFETTIYAEYPCNGDCSPNPSGCDPGLSCINERCRNPSCPDQTDCICKYPNCKNLSGPAVVVKNNNYTYQATYENLYGPVDNRGFVVLPTNCNWSAAQSDQTSFGGPGILYWNWTPTQEGTYTVFCRAWNDGIAECRGNCVDGPPRYLCPGPNAKMTVTVVTPTPYPTVAISGNLKEYLGAACYNNISTNNLMININPQYPASVNVLGPTIIPAVGSTRSTYNFFVVFNNQVHYPTPTPNPAQNLTLSASATGYSSAYWTNNNVCTNTANNTLFVNVSSGGSTVYNKDIFFANVSPWIKLKNASFGGVSSLTNLIPLSVTNYDSEDECPGCPNGLRYFIVRSINGDPGLVTASLINTGAAAVSTKNWKINNYQKQISFTLANFLEYVKARKEYQVITNLSNLSQDKINLWQGDLTITDQNQVLFNNKKVVLIVNGAVNFTVSSFQPNNGVLALIANRINFSPTTQYAEGLFIAQTINTGSTDNQGLKIKGNLIAQSTFNNNRRWSDNRKPSLFIIFDSKLYFDLLPYLSIAKYEWKQLQ